MYNFATIATQLFLALSVGTPTAAADFIGSVPNAPTMSGAFVTAVAAERTASNRLRHLKVNIIFC